MSTEKSNVLNLLTRLDKFERKGTIVGKDNGIITVLGNNRKTASEVTLEINSGGKSASVTLQAVQLVQLIEILDDYLDECYES